MPYDNEFNRNASRDVMQFNKRFLQHAKDTETYPYISPISAFTVRGADVRTGFGEIYGGRVDEVLAPKGDEQVGFWENLSHTLKHDVHPNDKASRVARDMAKGKTKEDIEKMLYNLKDIHDKEKLTGSGISDFIGKIISHIAKLGKSGKSFLNSAKKTFTDPQALNKDDFLNLYSMGAHTGFKKEKKKHPLVHPVHHAPPIHLPPAIPANVEGGKRRGRKKKVGGCDCNPSLEGKGLFDSIGDLLGLGAKGNGAKVYKKKKGGALHMQPTNEKGVSKQKTKNLKGGTQNPRKVGGANPRKVGGRKLLTKAEMPPTSLAGFGKKSWQETIAEVRQKPELKGKGLKEVIKHIKDNNLYKK